jgi:hypothetical protein
MGPRRPPGRHIPVPGDHDRLWASRQSMAVLAIANAASDGSGTSGTTADCVKKGAL